MMAIAYKKKETPALSIIIATLNVELTLEECLISILQQTSINNIEILVKDGISKDGTVNMLKSYDKHISFWESSPDAGIYDAWNRLLTKATGSWVLFLGADDALFNDTTVSDAFTQIDAAAEDIEVAYGKVSLVDEHNEIILSTGKDWDHAKRCIRQKMCIPHQGIFHKRSLFHQHGNFNTEYTISADYDFIRRSLKTDNVIYLDMLISCMRIGGISSNPDNIFIRLHEIRTINKHHGSLFPEPLWLITYVNAYSRKILFHIIGKKRGKRFLDRFRKLFGLPAYWTRL